jgi:predicted nucleic acid-binding protein
VIFVDTSFFYALVVARDRNHARAQRALEELGPDSTRERLLTTNHVIAETLTLVRRLSYAEAVRLGEALFSGQLVRLHRATAEQERTAFEAFKKYSDQDYSYVDCLSFVVMEDLGIREALTFDADFGHRFVMLPGPQ